MRELRRGRVDEKIQGVDEHDNSVKMVTFAQANKGLSMEDFIKKAGNISWIKSLSDTDAQCLIALGCVVLAKLNDTSRLNVWDTIFGVGKENGLLTDEEAHRIILNTYYDKKSPKSALEGVVSGLYHFWHNTPMYPAIKDTYSRTQSKDAAYIAGVCGSGSELDDEGNLHSSSGEVLDFDTISKDGSLKRKKKSESVEPRLSALERCDYILHYIEQMKKSAIDLQEYVKELKQTSWDDEDASNYKKFIEENKESIEVKLKDIEFCLKGI